MSATCRACGKELTEIFVDLGASPLSNSYIALADANKGEVFYPLKPYVCGDCFLVQLEEYETPSGIFSDYAYLSSFSDSWLAHAKRYAEQMVSDYGINSESMVVELASNDGYLLQYFRDMGVPTLGIEPAENVAKIAREKGIETVADFFSDELARRLSADGLRADLIVANNVLAHVPDLNSFVSGMNVLLADEGFITVEFPYLLNLIDYNQFDTIYHEHFSYFSLYSVCRVFERHGMRVFNVEQLETHGGSLRIFACHKDSARPERESVRLLLRTELERGVDSIGFYGDFKRRVERLKRDILSFFIEQKNLGKRICGYGAPAKGNTLLNYCGIGTDFIDFTVDRNPLKQGALLPGSRIPVYDVSVIKDYKPDYIVILPWNIKDEIIEQNSYIGEWGGKFVTLIPEVEVL